jgi:hypothetical protein
LIDLVIVKEGLDYSLIDLIDRIVLYIDISIPKSVL